jgi:hypothetical protein
MVSGKKHMNVLNLNRISEIKTVTWKNMRRKRIKQKAKEKKDL